MYTARVSKVGEPSARDGASAVLAGQRFVSNKTAGRPPTGCPVASGRSPTFETLPVYSSEALRDRAAMLRAIRAFFDARNVMEVDCPLVTTAASVDAHIDLIAATACGKRRWLHSSPEYGMKRLLADGVGDIYQLAHVFRDGEVGARHNPEFMMVEWYRRGMGFLDMVQETCELIQVVVGPLPVEVVSYKELFERELGIDPFKASMEELQELLGARGKVTDRDALLQLLLALDIEPTLGDKGLVALTYYPPTQAALAQCREHDGVRVAERFEVYYKGVELANGYHELQDGAEQRRRLEEANRERVALGKEQLPIDERFLAALEKGLPQCSGVAVGFDRLMMLRRGAHSLAEVIPFVWDQA